MTDADAGVMALLTTGRRSNRRNVSESSRPCAMAVNVLVKFSNALGTRFPGSDLSRTAVPIDIAIVVPLTSRGRGLEHHVRIDPGVRTGIPAGRTPRT